MCPCWGSVPVRWGGRVDQDSLESRAGVSVPSPCLTQVGGSGRLLQRPFASALSQPTGVLAQQLALLFTAITSTLSANQYL